MTDGLGYDVNGDPIGDRVVSSGWLVPSKVMLVKAEASGTVVFAGVAVFRGPPGLKKVQVIVNDQEVAGEPVVLDDDYLVIERGFGRTMTPHRAVLDDFLRLASDPSDAAILDYARQYGLLGLATAARPQARREVNPSPWVGELVAPWVGYRPAPTVMQEPLRLWRRIIEEVAAVYKLAGHLRQDKTVPPAAWDPLTGIVILPLPGGQPTDGPEPAPVLIEDAGALIWVRPATLEGQRQAVSAVLGTWLAMGVVRPVIAWGDAGSGDPVINLGTRTLFGGLVLELLLAVAGQPGFAMCSGCGLPYTPPRRPPTGSYGAARQTYCPACRAPSPDRKTPLPQLEAARRWRARNPDHDKGRRRGALSHGPGPQ